MSVPFGEYAANGVVMIIKLSSNENITNHARYTCKDGES